MHKEEKKVEYLELIYDLIFVYIIGRNNSLLHNLDNGFVAGTTFLAYILCSLAIIQIWNFSTFYINMHGRNSVRDHVALFLNMYLLYYIGEGTRLHWESFQNQYHIAWALILVNLGVQYAIEYKNHSGEPDVLANIKHMMIALFGEAIIVIVAIPIYNAFNIQLAGIAILYGMVVTGLFANKQKAEYVDFSHLTERAMLYVVFTFGEMIIAIASYFDGDFTFSSVFFSAVCFLIVVGLFLCYEMLYDKIIDREKKTNGMVYMIIHIFIIFGLNCITTSLEFMRNEEVDLMPKITFLVSAIILYVLCLFALQTFAKPEHRLCNSIIIPIIAESTVFAVLMFVFRENMYVNIIISLIYVFSVFAAMFIHSKKSRAQ